MARTPRKKTNPPESVYQGFGQPYQLFHDHISHLVRRGGHDLAMIPGSQTTLTPADLFDRIRITDMDGHVLCGLENLSDALVYENGLLFSSPEGLFFLDEKQQKSRLTIADDILYLQIIHAGSFDYIYAISYMYSAYRSKEQTDIGPMNCFTVQTEPIYVGYVNEQNKIDLDPYLKVKPVGSSEWHIAAGSETSLVQEPAEENHDHEEEAKTSKTGRGRKSRKNTGKKSAKARRLAEEFEILDLEDAIAESGPNPAVGSGGSVLDSLSETELDNMDLEDLEAMMKLQNKDGDNEPLPNALNFSELYDVKILAKPEVNRDDPDQIQFSIVTATEHTTRIEAPIPDDLSEFYFDQYCLVYKGTTKPLAGLDNMTCYMLFDNGLLYSTQRAIFFLDSEKRITTQLYPLPAVLFKKMSGTILADIVKGITSSDTERKEEYRQGDFAYFFKDYTVSTEVLPVALYDKNVLELF